MQKKYILFITTGIFFVLLIMIIVRCDSESNEVGKFSLDDYSRFLKDFSSDKILGEVLNSQDVKKKAEMIWEEVYGEEIQDEKPYLVSFDEENQVWLVNGTFHQNIFGDASGGVAYIIIQKVDGKVLAIWHDK